MTQEACFPRPRRPLKDGQAALLLIEAGEEIIVPLREALPVEKSEFLRIECMALRNRDRLCADAPAGALDEMVGRDISDAMIQVVSEEPCLKRA